MQLVDKKVLEELAKKQAVVESEKFSYEDFAKQWKQTYDETSEIMKTEDRRLTRTWHLMNRVLKKSSPPIRFVGEGSSRSAYACDGGKCLKVAMSKKGVMQNEVEVKNCYDAGQDTYSCFAKIYSHDPDCFTLLTECCSRITASQLAKELEVRDLYMMFRALDAIVNEFECDLADAYASTKEDLKSVQPAVLASEKEDQEYYLSVLRFCAAASSPTTPLQHVIADLVKFYADHGKSDDAMVLTDLENAKNWGYAIRDGALVPVIIDAGYNADVMHHYYPEM